jgi:NitT/TauT family transport system permease protein/putative hydroxymethylpyrimidine transport system permease protein
MAQDTAQINTTRVFASLVVLGTCGMIFFAVVGLLERIAMPWVYGRLAWPGLGLGAKRDTKPEIVRPADARE